MTRLRRIIGIACLWVIPRRVKEARIHRALRRMERSFSDPWHGSYNVTGYQTLSLGDPMMSKP